MLTCRRLMYLSILTLMCLGAGILRAGAEPGAIKISSTEEVIIAFYKTGGAVPGFDKWIKERDPYRTTALARRPDTYKREMLRLKTLYAAFDPEKDLLTIKSTVVARAAQYQNPADPEKPIERLEMRFPVGDADYFPYDFMGERFAVIPQDIREHMKPDVVHEQFYYLNNVLENGKPMTLIIELRPNKAVMDAPYNMDGTGGGVDHKDGKGQWMFLTDIASMSLWNKTGTLLWEYTAPWYITPMRKNLLELYVDKDAQE